MICHVSNCDCLSQYGVIDGWGHYLGEYLTEIVVNMAIGGRSARSFTRELSPRNHQLGPIWRYGGRRFSQQTQQHQQRNCLHFGDERLDSFDILMTHSLAFRRTTATPPVLARAKKHATSGTMWCAPTTGTLHRPPMLGKLEEPPSLSLPSCPVPTGTLTAGPYLPATGSLAWMAQRAAQTAKVQFIDHHAFSRREYEALGKARVDSM